MPMVLHYINNIINLEIWSQGKTEKNQQDNGKYRKMNITNHLREAVDIAIQWVAKVIRLNQSANGT